MQEAEDVQTTEALSRMRDVGDEGLGVALLEWLRGVAAVKLSWVTALTSWCFEMSSVRGAVLQRRRCWCRRRRRGGDSDNSDDVVQGVDEGVVSSGRLLAGARRRAGLRRRRCRGASGPNAFLLLKQGGEGVAEERQGLGVRHMGAERWGRTVDLVGGGTVCGAWLNQQRGTKEQADPFLQGVLLGERSRCWTVVKLVISPISLNKS